MADGGTTGGMEKPAEQPTDASAAHLADQMRALQARIDGLSDKLAESQREVLILTRDLNGQGVRINDIVGRIGDVNIWLAGFAILITLAIAFAGAGAYFQAARRAKDAALQWLEKEGRRWLDKEGETLHRDMELIIATAKERMEHAAQDVEDHSGKLKKAMSVGVETVSNLSEEDKRALSRESDQIKTTPESSYTAADWRTRAFAAYAARQYEDALFYFDKEYRSQDVGGADGAQALVNKGVVLGMLNRHQEAVDVYGEVVRQYNNGSSYGFYIPFAKSLVNRSWEFDLLGNTDDALRDINVVDKEFGEVSDVFLREHVARALVYKSGILGRLGEYNSVLAVCDEIDRRYGDDAALAIREEVARALCNKGVAFHKLEKFDDAIAVYDEIDRRYGRDDIGGLREQVAQALSSKAAALGAMGRHDAELAVYDEIDRRYALAAEPELRKLTARAAVNRAWVLYERGDFHALLLGSDVALAYDVDNDVAACNRAFALHLNGCSRAEVLAAYAQAWQVVGDAEKWDELALKDLRKHQTIHPDASPVPDDLIDAVAALARPA